MTVVPDVGLALVGCGGFGAYVLDAVRDIPGLRVVACADPDGERARVLAERHGAHVAASVEEVVGIPEVDVVVLATPPAAHADGAVTALRAGRHVFCEKPVAVTLEAAARVAEEASRAPGVFAVDHVLRYNPILRLLQRLGEEGLLDPLRRFSVRERRLRRGSRPGPLVLGPGAQWWHPHRARCALLRRRGRPDGQRPVAVHGTEVRRDGGPVDIVVATATHPGGSVATHTHSFTHARRAERQLMRLDYGFAEARVTGWIPTFATVTAWTDEAGAARWAQLPERADELLAVPGLRPHGGERITVSVQRDAGSDRPALGRGVRRVVPHRVDVVIDLGGEERKPHFYAESVRAAMTDLLHCAAHGGTPVADARAGLTAVAVAEAATRSAESGRTLPVTVPSGTSVGASA